jgi:hypothetical protein
MPFTLRRYQRFPLYCAVTYRAGLDQSQGTIWNFSLSRWKLSNGRAFGKKSQIVLYGQNAGDPQVLRHQSKRGTQRLLSTQNGHSW